MARIQLPRQVGIVVGRARRAKGITQGELARAAGVSRQLVNRLEMGTATGIALDKLMAILNAAGCALAVYPVDDREGASGALDPLSPSTTSYAFGSLAPSSTLEPFDPAKEYPLDESLFAPPRPEVTRERTLAAFAAFGDVAANTDEVDMKTEDIDADMDAAWKVPETVRGFSR